MKALIVGATGLIGNELLHLLENDNTFTEIEIWVRKTIHFNSNKLKVKITDFDNLSDLQDFSADVVFCCVGTTIKKAKSKENFRKVDFEIPVKISGIVEKAGIQKYIIVSSVGADKDSDNFYLKTKGQMEEAISQKSINSVIFMRPSILLGNRKEFRFGEIIGKYIMQLAGFMIIGKLKKYRAIHANTVAKAMIYAAKSNYSGINILEYNEIKKMANFYVFSHSLNFVTLSILTKTSSFLLGSKSIFNRLLG